MGSNLKQEAMERAGEVEHHECYYDTDRNKPLPGRAAAPVAGSVGDDENFIFLMCEITGIDICGENFKRLVAYIDSRASATRMDKVK